MRERLALQLRSTKPLYVQRRLATEHRDKLVKKHLELVSGAGAMEELLNIKEAEAADALKEAEEAASQVADLAELYEQEVARESEGASPSGSVMAGGMGEASAPVVLTPLMGWLPKGLIVVFGLFTRHAAAKTRLQSRKWPSAIKKLFDSGFAWLRL